MPAKEWMWRLTHFALTAVVALGVYTLKVDRRNDIVQAVNEVERRMQSSFVSRTEFEAYKTAHSDWSQQVILRIEQKISDLQRTLDETYRLARERERK